MATPGASPASGPLVPPPTYQDFAAKMKLPGAQDLVKTLKNYVKFVQAPDWLAKVHQAVAVAHTPTPGETTTEANAPVTSDSASTVVAAGAVSVAPAVPSVRGGGPPVSAAAAAAQSEFDRVKGEYSEVITGIMKTIKYKHPLWKGSPADEIDNALESIEKFLTSKLYDRFFGLFPADRARDAAITERLFILHTWVKPQHFDLPAYCCAEENSAIWQAPAEEIRNMDKFKSPRDKLVCLLNCCHIINNILKRAKLKANAEKAEALEAKRRARALELEEREARRKEEQERREKEKAKATTAASGVEGETPGGVASSAESSDTDRDRTDSSQSAILTASSSSDGLGKLSLEETPTTSASATAAPSTPAAAPTVSAASQEARRNSLEESGFTPSSSPSADDFFPALLYTLIYAQPQHLYLNLVYISLCRSEAKLHGGEAAYWYTNLASAIQFLEVAGEKSFTFEKVTAASATAAAAATAAPTTTTTAAAGVKELGTVAVATKSTFDQLMHLGKLQWDEARRQEEDEKARVEQEAREKRDQEEAAQASMQAIAAAAQAANTPVPTADPMSSGTPIVGGVDLLTSATSSSSATSAGSPHPPGGASALIHNHGASSWTVSSASGSSSGAINVAPTPLPPPCIACLHLSHRRVPTQFLDREFTSLTIGELQDVLREYKELCFVLQGWQEAASHREMKSMPLPAKVAHPDGVDGDGLTLTGSDAFSAAPSSASVAASTAPAVPAPSPPAATPVAPPTSRGWPLTNFLGLGRTR